MATPSSISMLTSSASADYTRGKQHPRPLSTAQRTADEVVANGGKRLNSLSFERLQAARPCSDSDARVDLEQYRLPQRPESDAERQLSRSSRSARRRSTVLSFRERRESMRVMESIRLFETNGDKENAAQDQSVTDMGGKVDQDTVSAPPPSTGPPLEPMEISSEISTMKKRVSVHVPKTEDMTDNQNFYLQSLEKLDLLANRLQYRTNSAEADARDARESALKLEETVRQSNERIRKAQSNEALAIAKIKQVQKLSAKRAAAFDLKEQELREEVLEANKQVAKLTEEIQNLEDQSRHNSNTLQAIKSQATTLETTLDSQTKALSIKEDELKTKANEVISLEGKLDASEREISAQTARMDTLNKLIESKSDEIEDLKNVRLNESNSIEMQQEAAEKSIAALEADKNRFKDELQIALDQLSEANISSQRLSDEVQDLKGARADLQTQVSELSRSLSDVTQECKSMSEATNSEITKVEELVTEKRQLASLSEELEQKVKTVEDSLGRESALRADCESRLEIVNKQLDSANKISAEQQSELKDCYKVEQELTSELYEFESLLSKETAKTTRVRQELASVQEENAVLAKRDDSQTKQLADLKKEYENATVSHKETRQEYFESVRELKELRRHLAEQKSELKKRSADAAETLDRFGDFKSKIQSGQEERDCLLDELQKSARQKGDLCAQLNSKSKALEMVELDFRKSVEREKTLKERVRLLEVRYHKEKSEIDPRTIAIGAAAFCVGIVTHVVTSALVGRSGEKPQVLEPSD